MIKNMMIIIALLTSCSVIPIETQKQKDTKAIFKPYIEEYRNIIGNWKYQKRFDRLTIDFADIGGFAVGRCWWVSLQGKKIEIDTKWWNDPYTTLISKRLVVFHELEHCIRYRMHTDKVTEVNDWESFFDELGYILGLIPKPGFFKDGCPVSVMNSEVAAGSCQEKYYNVWVKEMMDLK